MISSHDLICVLSVTNDYLPQWAVITLGLNLVFILYEEINGECISGCQFWPQIIEPDVIQMGQINLRNFKDQFQNEQKTDLKKDLSHLVSTGSN